MDEELLRKLFELAKTNNFETDTEILNAGFESIEFFNRIKGISDNIDGLIDKLVPVNKDKCRKYLVKKAIKRLIREVEE